MPLDVLIVTAKEEEYQAVLQVTDGATPTGTWRVQPGPNNARVAYAQFAADSAVLNVAVFCVADMGPLNTMTRVHELLPHLNPRCLAMCGVCAGRKGKVNLGDVIIADRIFSHNTGAVVSTTNPQGQRHNQHQPAPDFYYLDLNWKEWCQDFAAKYELNSLLKRPRSCEDQENWFMKCLLDQLPLKDQPDKEERCANIQDVIARLQKSGLVRALV